MGLYKRELQRQQEEGWSPVKSSRLCRRCLESGSSFTVFFRSESEKGKCDYCRKNKKTVEINDLIAFISRAIHSEYGDPANFLPYESAEGGYYIGKIYDVCEILEMHIDFVRDDVQEDIVRGFDHSRQWCEKDALSGSESDELHSLWLWFSDLVKYKRRFFFAGIMCEEFRDNPSKILDKIFHISVKLKLISIVKRGTTIFRARAIKTIDCKKESLTFENIVIPPPRISVKSSNRLSAAGIPVFYGAFSSDHLASEVRIKSDERMMLAEFKLLKNIYVLDLTQRRTATLFDDNDTQTREVIRFLNSFREEIIKPVDHDGSEHVEYVPSQVFAEFIRHKCRHKGRKILGIKYPSAGSAESVNLAVFTSNNGIADASTVADARASRYLEFLNVNFVTQK